MKRKLRGHDPKHAKASRPIVMIFGKPGVGKTWICLDFPSCYFLDCEGGANLPHYTKKLSASGGLYLGPDEGANDFEVVVGEVQTLAFEKHPYRTLVIDSYSKLFNTAVQQEYEKMELDGKDMMRTFGREKRPAVGKTRQLIRLFDTLDMNVILVAHEKDRYEKGEIVDRTFDGWDKIDYELDLVMQISRVGHASTALIRKSRLHAFDQGDSMEWSYAAFAEKYGRDVIEAEHHPAKPATPQQVKRCKELINATLLDLDLQARWLEKAGVSEFHQMSYDNIAACIRHLEEKQEGMANEIQASV